MDVALKEIVFPALRSMGFKGSPPHFRRAASNRIDLLTFQFDKWGGGFVIEVARCSPIGITTSWGKSIPPNKVTAWDVLPSFRKRIQPVDGSGRDSWFRFDAAQQPEDVARLVLNNLSRAETWWQMHA